MNSRKKICQFVSMSLLPHVLVAAIVMLVLCIVSIASGDAAEEALVVSLIPGVGYLLIFGLFFYLPSVIRVSRSLKALENKGLLDAAAKELRSSHTMFAVKNRVAVSENFVFAKGSGVCLASDILWIYRRRNSARFLFFTYFTADFLMFHTAQQQYSVAMYKKDKKEELKQVLYAIYQKKPEMLTGWANEKAFKQLRKQIRNQSR